MARRSRFTQGRTPGLSFRFKRPLNDFSKKQRIVTAAPPIDCDGIVDNVTTYVFELTAQGKLAYVDCDYVV